MSNFPKGSYYEYYDRDTLRKCISYLLNNKSFKRGDTEIKNGIDPKIYFAYLGEYDETSNCSVVSYDKGSNDVFGLYRVYGVCSGVKGSSAISFMRELRAALYSDKYYDIDIINAHPHFMYAITKGVTLGEYINNREKYLSEVIETANVSRDTAKQLFIMMGYGGSYKTWYETNAPDVKPTKFVVDYYNEMNESRDIIINHFTNKIKTDRTINKVYFRKPDGLDHNVKLKKIVIADSYASEKGKKDEYACINAAISKCMQWCEIEVIKMVYNYLQNQGVDISRLSYQFDGFMILKEDVDKLGIDINTLVQNINDYIHNQSFVIDLSNINFISKPFENTIDISKYPICKYNTYEEYIADQPEYIEYPDEPFSWNTLRSLREDKMVEYINKYCVFEYKTCEFIIRYNKYDDLVYYSDVKFKILLKQNKIDKSIYDKVLPATRRDDVDKPQQWIYTDNITGDRYYNTFMGLLPDVIEGKYNKEIADAYEKFIDSFGIGNDIIPLKRVIGSIACRAGVSIPKLICIASDGGFGKDTFMRIIRSWYESNETSSASLESLIGNFNYDAGKCVVELNECHDRRIDVVNKIKDLVTAMDVTINNKYAVPVKKQNHLTIFCFSNTTQGLPVDWETGDRRALFYNLIGQIKHSVAKEFNTKYANHPDLASSCWHRACEWFDPEYDFHRDIITESKNIMNANNMPDIVYTIYESYLYGKLWSSSELRDRIISITGDEKLSSKSFKKQMITYFGDSIYKRISAGVVFDLENAKSFIEDKWSIPVEMRNPDNCICEF